MMRQNVSWPDAEELWAVKRAARRWAKRVGVPTGIAVSAFVREACRRMLEQENLQVDSPSPTMEP